MEKRTLKITLVILCIILFLSILTMIYFWMLFNGGHGTKISFDEKKISQKINILFNNKLKICPDEGYNNQMPGPPSLGTTQYFILDGERRELSEFNLEWIKKNCDLEVQGVV